MCDPLCAAGLVHQPRPEESVDGAAEDPIRTTGVHVRQIRPPERPGVASAQSLVHPQCSHARSRHGYTLPHDTHQLWSSQPHNQKR